MTYRNLANTDTDDHRALHKFVGENADLKQLELRIGAFNIFEAVGMVGQEIRHSHFLAFLLDPSQNHGLKDTFLKRFLSLALHQNGEHDNPAPTLVTQTDLDKWDLSDAEVAREQDHIDVRVSIASLKLVIIVENKLYTGEHSDQLARYLLATQSRYPGWRVLPIFLTLDGGNATDSRYLPVGYAQVAELVQDAAERSESVMSRDANALLRHYVQMLRRHHLPDQELDDLCARIYRQHRRALDLIFERRPDRQSEVARLVIQRIRDAPDIDHLNRTDGKRWIVFNPSAWSLLPNFYSPGKWSEHDSGLLFVFDNSQHSLMLKLQINPVREDIRQRLWQFTGKVSAPFKRGKNLASSFPTVYKRTFLDAAILDEEMDVIEEAFSAQWNAFVAGDLPVIRSAVEAEFRE